ncbi:hypothetical protein AAFF27_01240 [Xylophilus sp. GW821-FHT01B05]
MDDEQWITGFAAQAACRWPCMATESLTELARGLATEPHWRELEPSMGADNYVRSMEELCWVEPSAMELSIDMEGASAQSLALGVAAALEVFRAANVSPAAGARAIFARDSWGALGYPEEALPAATFLDAARAWEKAELAAHQACCGDTAASPQACTLRLGWRVPEQQTYRAYERSMR